LKPLLNLLQGVRQRLINKCILKL